MRLVPGINKIGNNTSNANCLLFLLCPQLVVRDRANDNKCNISVNTSVGTNRPFAIDASLEASKFESSKPNDPFVARSLSFLSRGAPSGKSERSFMASQALVIVLVILVAVIIVFEAMQLSWSGSSADTRTANALVELNSQLDFFQNRTVALERELSKLRAAFEATPVTTARAAVAATPPATCANRQATNSKRFHFVFSADCRYPPRVHWQSVVLLYSFIRTQV
jgi:hypothetical protein